MAILGTVLYLSVGAIILDVAGTYTKKGVDSRYGKCIYMGFAVGIMSLLASLVFLLDAVFSCCALKNA